MEGPGFELTQSNFRAYNKDGFLSYTEKKIILLF